MLQCNPIYKRTLFLDCGVPSSPANGSVIYITTIYGSVITYACDIGFNLHGDHSAICEKTGQWSNRPPTCTIVG